MQHTLISPLGSKATRGSGAQLLLYWMKRTLRLPVPVKLADARRPHNDNDNFRQMTFTFAVIALAAKLSEVDGKMNRREFQSFYALFPMPHEEHVKIQKLFTMACQEKSDPAHYARQILHLFPERTTLYEELLKRLCQIACADGAMAMPEKAFLEKIASIFGVNHSIIQPFYAASVAPADPYQLLGVARNASNERIKKAYRERIRALHPDRMMAEGGDAQDIAHAHAGLAAVNDAYALIAKKRKIK